MYTLNALQLAEHILATYPDKNITPMKLQKLAYYTKVWTLVAGSKVVTADFKKWALGPVNQNIYNVYKSHGGNVIKGHFEKKLFLREKEFELVHFILDNYADFSAFSLSAMTHKEGPWVKTPQHAVISDELIISYYSSQPFAKNFYNSEVKKGPFHLIQSDSWHSFTLDMDETEAANFESYPSFEDYKKQSKDAENDSKKFFEDIFS